MCEKEETCPECGESFTDADNGHDYDHILEFGKCVECAGGVCPYCAGEDA